MLKHISETTIQQNIRLAVSRGNTRVFRNNVGMQNGITYGLGVGSSDLIGWTSREITPDMVGQKVAIFTALEVKTDKGRVSKPQQNFIDVVNAAGGIAAIVRNESEAVSILKGIEK